MRSLVLCATLTVVILPRSAVAQSVLLTESDALARLSADSPRVRAIRAGIEVARADVVAAGRWPNPRVVFDREAVAGITEYLTTVSQPLPITGQRDQLVHAASALVDAAIARSDDELRRARADLRLAFARLLSAQTREQALAAARDRLRSGVDVLKKREAAGDSAGFDRLRVARELIDVEADLAIAASDRARAQGALAGFFAESGDAARIIAAPDSAPRAPLPSVEALIVRAESTRGDLVALQKDIEAANWSLRAAERRRVPEPELVAGIKSSTALGGDMGSVVSVQAAIPLFDHGRAEGSLAEARRSQSEARAAALRVTLSAEIAGLHASVLERRAAADRYRTEIVNSADRIEQIALVSYDAGERGILELLDAYRIGVNARIRQATLDAAVREAEIELEFVSAWENLK